PGIHGGAGADGARVALPRGPPAATRPTELRRPQWHGFLSRVRDLWSAAAQSCRAAAAYLRAWVKIPCHQRVIDTGGVSANLRIEFRWNDVADLGEAMARAKLLSSKTVSALGLAIAVAVGTAPTLAATVNQNGTDGQTGAAGSPGGSG